MKPIEVHWNPLNEINWIQLKSIDKPIEIPSEVTLKFIEVHWNLLKSIAIYWNSLNGIHWMEPLEVNRSPLNETNWNPLKSIEWNPIEVHGNLLQVHWNSSLKCIEIHGNWNLLNGIHWMEPIEWNQLNSIHWMESIERNQLKPIEIHWMKSIE